MHDLTEGQAQEAQKKRGDDLAEANRSKEDFMALLSHELRSPSISHPQCFKRPATSENG